jgi:DNA-directed RNA polymerase subunit RPC12/RpoP
VGAWSTLGESMHVCGYERCGRAFASPVRLTDLSHRPRLETYFACPYCFSKVNESEMAEMNGLLHSGGYEIPALDSVKGLKRGDNKRSGGAETTVNCQHNLGYLKTRSKGEAFPDGCLTCPRILQCMV